MPSKDPQTLTPQQKYERLALAVRSQRERSGLTQLDVHANGGPSNSTLTQIEAAREPRPTGSTLRKLDRGLGWPSGLARLLLESDMSEDEIDEWQLGQPTKVPIEIGGASSQAARGPSQVRQPAHSGGVRFYAPIDLNESPLEQMHQRQRRLFGVAQQWAEIAEDVLELDGDPASVRQVTDTFLHLVLTTGLPELMSTQENGGEAFVGLMRRMNEVQQRTTALLHGVPGPRGSSTTQPRAASSVAALLRSVDDELARSAGAPEYAVAAHDEEHTIESEQEHDEFP